MGRPEQILQQALFAELTPLMFLQKYQQFIAFQIRNETGVGGEKGKFLGELAKSMGTMAGVSDTGFLFPKRAVQMVDHSQAVLHGRTAYAPTVDKIIPPKIVFAELKALKPLKTKEVDPLSLLNPDQVKFKNRVEDMGFEYRIFAAQNVKDLLNQVKEFLSENYVSTTF